jgi:DnaK suppressor protein
VKATAKKVTAKKAPTAKKASAPVPTKAPARKASPVKIETAATSAAATAAKPATKARGGKGGKLAVREGEKPWTAAEIREVRATLESDAARLKAEIAATEEEIGHLLREGGEGAGNDQADVGSNTFERDHEMTMAKNARESLHIIEAALARIDDGSYGVCESCGKPIGKMRLQAFPRATLCMECKQRQERR